jgi:hypothetical protein
VRLRALIGPALVTLLAGSLTACETTQDTSNRLARQAKGMIHQKGLSVTRLNPDVRVEGTFVLHDSNGTAAVVALKNAGRAPEVDVPVSIAVTGRGGATLYRNDAGGLERSLVALSLLPSGASTYWVNDQVVSALPARAVQARIGLPRGHVPASVPRIRLSSVQLGSDQNGSFAKGIVENDSKVPQKRLVITGVAVKGTRVVAAGRGIVDLVPPAPTNKPTRFTIFFIGNPKGGRLLLSAPPTVLG